MTGKQAFILSFAVVLSLGWGLVSFGASSEKLPQFKGAEDRKAYDAEIREQMKVISRQLGVNCATCHNTKNFSQGDKHEFKVALHHIKIVQNLIDLGFDGKDKNPKADCYMCHRGSLKFEYKEPFDKMTMDPLKHSGSGKGR